MTEQAKIKWTDEVTDSLKAIVANVASPIALDAVEDAASQLGTTSRSVAAKLRRMGYDVATKEKAGKLFSDEEANSLRSFVSTNEGNYTYAEIASAFAGGKFSAKAIQGKLLHMELTDKVKPTPKKVHVSTFTLEDEQKILGAWVAGKFIEEIAEVVGRPVATVRGKILAMSRKEGAPGTFPATRDKKVSSKEDVLSFDVTALTVAEIAAKAGKTERGIKTMLTRRKLVCADYDGAAKAEKSAKE